MAVTINQIKQLYDQYATYLSAAVLDSTVTEVSYEISGKMDACRQLVVLGTNNNDESTPRKYAQITADYFSGYIDRTLKGNELIEDFTTGLNNDSIKAMELSSHYIGLYKSNVFPLISREFKIGLVFR